MPDDPPSGSTPPPPPPAAPAAEAPPAADPTPAPVSTPAPSPAPPTDVPAPAPATEAPPAPAMPTPTPEVAAPASDAAASTSAGPHIPDTTPPSSAPEPPAQVAPVYPVSPSGAVTGAAAAAGSGLSSPASWSVAQYGPPPAVHHLARAPESLPRSSLPAQLKRLGYIVSLVLGGGAVLAGLWSIFLLPLLHATFSARNALAAAQKERWTVIVDKLRSIRALSMFPEPSAEAEARADALAPTVSRDSAKRSDKHSDKQTEEKEKEKDDKLALQRSRSPDSPRSASISISATEDTPHPPIPTVPLRADTADLSAALKDLAASLNETSTTRTSLLSTLETYTSGLHRELFLARSSGASTPWGPVPGATTGRVGLGTLSANLAHAGGKVASGSAEPSPLGIPAARSDEWDSVRREVRAIKGLLLNRRNFAVPSKSS